MITSQANSLIETLFENPEEFFDKGLSYDLLQCYFDGFSIESLRPLLMSENTTVQKVAIWIVSELGSAANDLSDLVVALIKTDTRYIKFYCLDSIALFSSSGKKDLFHIVLEHLLNEDYIVGKRAMYLTSNASELVLLNVLKHMRAEDQLDHEKGLSLLIEGTKSKWFSEIKKTTSILLQMYLAMYIKRNPHDIHLKSAFNLESCDPSIVTFFEDYILGE
jgi:archaellin